MDSEILRFRFLPRTGMIKMSCPCGLFCAFSSFSYSSKSRLNPTAFGFVLFFARVFSMACTCFSDWFFANCLRSSPHTSLKNHRYSQRFRILSLIFLCMPTLALRYFFLPLRLKTLFLPFLWYLQQRPFYSALSLQFIVSSSSFYFASRWTPLPSAKSLFCFQMLFKAILQKRLRSLCFGAFI